MVQFPIYNCTPETFICYNVVFFFTWKVFDFDHLIIVSFKQEMRKQLLYRFRKWKMNSINKEKNMLIKFIIDQTKLLSEP